jgi:hypothetical protein
MHAKSLAFNSLVGRIAEAAGRECKLIAAALATGAVDCIAAGACLDLLVRAVPPVAIS